MGVVYTHIKWLSYRHDVQRYPRWYLSLEVKGANCSMIENIQQKGENFSDFISIFAISIEDLFNF